MVSQIPLIGHTSINQTLGILAYICVPCTSLIWLIFKSHIFAYMVSEGWSSTYHFHGSTQTPLSPNLSMCDATIPGGSLLQCDCLVPHRCCCHQSAVRCRGMCTARRRRCRLRACGAKKKRTGDTKAAHDTAIAQPGRRVQSSHCCQGASVVVHLDD